VYHQNETRQWQTIRELLSTHIRITVFMKDKDGNIYHHHASGKPEDVHQDIYKKLGFKTLPRRSLSVLNRL